MKKRSTRPQSADEFDRYFEGHDIADLLDTGTKRVNVDFPAVVLRCLDLKAQG